MGKKFNCVLNPSFHGVAVANEGHINHLTDCFNQLVRIEVGVNIVFGLNVPDFENAAGGVKMEPEVGVGRHTVVCGNAKAWD
jgi:hypothetical protein